MSTNIIRNGLYDDIRDLDYWRQIFMKTYNRYRCDATKEANKIVDLFKTPTLVLEFMEGLLLRGFSKHELEQVARTLMPKNNKPDWEEWKQITAIFQHWYPEDLINSQVCKGDIENLMRPNTGVHSYLLEATCSNFRNAWRLEDSNQEVYITSIRLICPEDFGPARFSLTISIAHILSIPSTAKLILIPHQFIGTIQKLIEREIENRKLANQKRH
ncbi:hypothetical protein Fcan01_22204 [Folsomia candida]|uniref:Uncharacterized protein n=1 Tax=Folsomia candida TaxID=158441 RepID=A0A226DCE2_FOLCA|nr:hypothetical protein Fcan01_22204 [Folsomia candida]